MTLREEDFLRVKIANNRLRLLALSCLSRAFHNEILAIARIGLNEEATRRLFEFYCLYIQGIRWLNKRDLRGLARARMTVGGKVQEKGEILVMIPDNLIGDYTDEELLGLVAHELGHLQNEFHFGESINVRNQDVTEEAGELDADETARDLGFSKEIEALHNSESRHQSNLRRPSLQIRPKGARDGHAGFRLVSGRD